MAPCPLLETVVWHDLFLGRPRSRRYPKFKFNIRRDIPPYAEDLLRREPFGKGLSRLVNYGSGTGVVLIDADWGSGKTTFLRMWIQQAWNDGNVVALVNAWDGDYRGSPLEYLAEQLTRAPERYVQGNIFTRMVTRIRQVWFRLSGSILRVLRIGTAVGLSH